MRRILKSSYFIIFSAALVLVSIWFRNGNLLGTAESGLPFNNLANFASIMKYAWAYPALGNQTGVQVASAPTYWLLSILESFSIKSYILQATIFLGLLLISSFSVFLLTKEFFPKINSRYALLSAFAYWFNPLSLVIVWNRFLYNFIYFWAFLPLSSLLVFRGFKKKNIVYALHLSLFSTLFSYIFTSPAFFIMYWLNLLMISLYFIYKVNIKFYLTFFGVCILSFALFNWWWLSQLFLYIISGTYGFSTTTFFTSLGNQANLTTISDRLGNFINIYRLLHGDFFIYGPFWTRYFLGIPFTLLGLFLTGLIMFCLLKYRNKRKITFLTIWLVFLLFLIKGNQAPLGEIFEVVFNKISYLQIFRNPFEKFGLMIMIPYSILLGYSVFVLRKYIPPRIFIVFKYIIFTYVIFGWGFPFWTGLVFTYNSKGLLNNYEVTVPDYYQSADQWFTEEFKKPFRLLSLPINGEGISYKWEKPYTGIELSSGLFKVPNVSFSTTIPFYFDVVENLKVDQDSEEIVKYLPFLNIKYLLIRSDIDYDIGNYPNHETVESGIKSLIDEGDLIFEKQFGSLRVYSVDDKYFWPKIYSTKNILIANFSNYPEIVNNLNDFPETKFVTVGLDSDLISPDSDIIIKPELTTEIYNDNNLAILKNEELIQKLPYSKYLPGDIKHKLLLAKEYLVSPNNNDLEKWLEYQVDILGKRVVEIYKVKESNLNNNIVSSARENYIEQNKIVYEGINKYILRNKKINEIIKDSLFTQLEIIKRTDPELNDLALNLILLSKQLIPNYLTFSKGEVYKNYQVETPLTGEYYFNLPECKNNCSIYIDGIKRNTETKFLLKVGRHKIETLTNNIDNPKTSLINGLILRKNSGESNYFNSTTQIDFEYVDPTLYKVNINKFDSDKEILVLSELYNSGWKAYDSNGVVFPNERHVLVNSFANGWLIDKPGSYGVLIKYEPQEHLNKGIWISAVSIIFTLIILLSQYVIKNYYKKN